MGALPFVLPGPLGGSGASAFFFKTISQVGISSVKLTFSQPPLTSNPAGVNDALNVANYTVSGPAVNNIINITTVFGDNKSVYIILAAPLQIGTWIFHGADALHSVIATPLSAPKALNLLVTNLNIQESVSGGAINDDEEKILRKHLNAALKGKGWNSIIAGMATGDKTNADNARLAFDQLFISTASGLYLDQRCADNGVSRPVDLGMSDEVFRKFAIKTTVDKLTQESFLEVLEVFYGSDAVRAYSTTDLTEPFALNDADDLEVLIDEKISVKMFFGTDEFAIIGNALAIEVAASITRNFRLNGSKAFAIALQDPETGLNKVRIYSSSLGLSSSVRITGGRAQNFLQFPDRINTPSVPLPIFPTWNISINTATRKVRFTTTTTPTDVDLMLITEGDYVNVFGTEFQPQNRGSFPITAVSVFYNTLGTIKTQYFEIDNVNAMAQIVAQVSADSIEYFQPTKKTIHTGNRRTVLVAQTDDEVDVTLPATTVAVNRTAFSAAYAQVNPSIAITSLQRDGAGLVTVHAIGHGLTTGQHVFVDNVLPSEVSDTFIPPTVVGNYPLGISDSSLATIWSPTKNASTGRTYHTSNKLNNGKVLITGGRTISALMVVAYLNTSELFTVTATNTLPDGSEQIVHNWALTGAYPTTVERHRANLLQNGKVFASGGRNGGGDFNAANLYDAGAATWSPATPMVGARNSHGQSVFTYGNVLVTGGLQGTTTLASTQEYDVGSDTWIPKPAMHEGRFEHAQVTLTTPTVFNDLIMVSGGRQITAIDGLLDFTLAADTGVLLQSCELFDPLAVTWTKIASMNLARFGHKLIALPDGKVVAIGGWAVDVTQGVPAPTATCEMWDPNGTKLWAMIGPMSVARPYPVAEYISELNTIYVAGGPDGTSEYLDLRTMKWKRSLGNLGVVRQNAASSLLDNGAVLLSGGKDLAGTTVTTASDRLLIPAQEKVYSGGLNTSVAITFVDVDHFTYRTPEFLNYTKAGLAIAISMTAESAVIPGPFTYDPIHSPAVTGIEKTLNQDLVAGHQYASISLANPGDALAFPDEPGWLAVGFGTEQVVFPIRYLGRLSSEDLRIDFGFKFPKTLLASGGYKVTLLSQKAGFVPQHPEEVGSFYLTDSNAGRIVAGQTIDAIEAAGVSVRKTIVYPGDRGLGGEGLPTHGVDKLSDAVEVWGGNELDTEIAAAREEP